ncbi:hypothetical protein TNCV_2256541 [Trichonephila clavipes]|nr:hypothetical protein TNCV_2256541 [Trichonephila clavipes]
MIAYGIRPRPRHGQWPSHNNAVYPLLPIDMQLEIPFFFSKNMYGNNIWPLNLSGSGSYKVIVENETRPSPRSWVRILLKLKTRRVEELRHVKSVIVQSPSVGMEVWTTRFQFKCRSIHLTSAQDYGFFTNSF